jgi:hypothetical protein
MNGQKIHDLLLDGAYLDILEHRIYHPSFRKGWRVMSSGDISFCAALRKLGHKNYRIEDGKYFANSPGNLTNLTNQTV